MGNALDAVPGAMVLGIALRDRASPSCWCSHSRLATFPRLYRAQRGCGLPVAATPTSFCSGVRSPSGQW
jgi:hypothetical protein